MSKYVRATISLDLGDGQTSLIVELTDVDVRRFKAIPAVGDTLELTGHLELYAEVHRDAAD